MSKDKIKLYDTQISKNPNSGISYLLRAEELEKCWKKTKDISYKEQAKSCYEKAIKLEPDRVDWLMTRVKFYVSINELELAALDIIRTQQLPVPEGIIGIFVENCKQDIMKLANVQKTIAKLLESEDSRLEDYKQAENQQIEDQELLNLNGLVKEFY